MRNGERPAIFLKMSPKIQKTLNRFTQSSSTAAGKSCPMLTARLFNYQREDSEMRRFHVCKLTDS